MSKHKTVKDTHKLTCCLAVLNKLNSRYSNKCTPVFKMTNTIGSWITTCQQLFRNTKAYLQTDSELQNPKSSRTIGVYLAHLSEALSSFLFIDKTSKPMYFVSKKLAGVELRYPELYKVAIALVHSAKRLDDNFQGRTIKVYTEYPLKRSFRPDRNKVT